ncbi:glutathione S-transferase C-terminal domain-containing protein-like isoform X3 [Meleagris gallopavo]|uniref:glutathione S-transferase C-terminal domain-containing protein-like isoform X3 n=1 Tax=Meleagris gallopavo TaxID=9103 RepID=UPI00093BB36D|nr:glutathione S-transferase C-terminal domain-containing protein-like isoform X3 [Meleagris gallopavo]
MKDSIPEEHLYLGFSHQCQDSIFPLHTSISLFLLSYCDCKSFKIFLVPTNENANDPFVTKNLLGDLEVHLIPKCQLPMVVQSCCLPAVVTKDGKFCRAGLSVVLRHIVQKTFEADPSKKNVLELLGFKKTCLKACAEVSQWTRLCEISIPLAVEGFLTASPEHSQTIPADILQLERKLGEPVRVHNDDKIRRRKLQQQKVYSKKQGKDLVNLPLISSWYQRVQQVPRVKEAAGKCNMQLLQLPELIPAPEEHLEDFFPVPDDFEEEHENSQFIGGPRPTMTKLMERGIEAKFSPHPCPDWTIDWTSLPAAVNPGEAYFSDL